MLTFASLSKTDGYSYVAMVIFDAFQFVYLGVRLSGLERLCSAPPVKRSRMNTLDKYFSGGCDADNCEVKSKRRKQGMTDETTEREVSCCYKHYSTKGMQ